jgi:hypothetical protein
VVCCVGTRVVGGGCGDPCGRPRLLFVAGASRKEDDPTRPRDAPKGPRVLSAPPASLRLEHGLLDWSDNMRTSWAVALAMTLAQQT